MKSKHLIFASFLLLVLPMASSLEFRISVDDVVNSSEYRLRYSENASIQQINVTLENSGSIGCEYRLKGKFSYNDQTRTRYSDPYPLFPGAQALGELYFIPENYTGRVNTEIYSLYCEREEKIGEFNFTSPEKLVPNRTISSETLKVSEDSSRVKINVERGRMVPSETPSFWKASSAEIRRGEATVKYDAPIFQEGETLKYTVVKNQSVLGETKVRLKERKTLIDRLKDKKLEILLGLSLLLNLGLLFQKIRRVRK